MVFLALKADSKKYENIFLSPLRAIKINQNKNKKRSNTKKQAKKSDNFTSRSNRENTKNVFHNIGGYHIHRRKDRQTINQNTSLIKPYQI